MRIAFIGDCHVGNHGRHGGKMVGSINERCAMTLEAVSLACTAAVKARADHLFVVGDLIDYNRPEAAVLRALQVIFEKAGRSGLAVHLLVGNHEQTSTAPDDHALSPLRPSVASVIDKPRVYHGDVDVLAVPFRKGRAKDWLADTVRGMLAASEGDDAGTDGLHRPVLLRRRILAIHLGIRDVRTPPWLRNSPDAIDVADLEAIGAEHGIALVVAGNWHNAQKWVTHPGGQSEAMTIVQVGALCPTGWDNPSSPTGKMREYGRVVFTDDASTPTVVHLPGPRFVKARSQEEFDAATATAAAAGHSLFLEWDVAPEEMLDAKQAADEARAAGSLHVVEVLPDVTVAKQEAKNAGRMAKAEGTFDDALATFVDQCPMPEEVNRANVLERAKAYLA